MPIIDLTVVGKYHCNGPRHRRCKSKSAGDFMLSMPNTTRPG